jgi:tRNA nucleotidyltransferase/poly(A) polymerase
MAKNYLSNKLRALPFYNEVTKAGGKIYAVGGPVRDFILGKQSKDLDIIVTGIDYDLLNNILDKYGKTDLVGKSFGIIKFRETPTSEEIDVALPRTEKKTGQGYQGFDVTVDPNMSVEDEMKRRDLTINSLAMDGDGNIVDPFNGLNDIKNKIIRATSNDSFSEDPLRMLRVVQFATRFGFNLDSQTESMINQNADLIKEISPERYIIEFEKIVSKGKPIQGIKLLVDLNLFEPIFGFQYNGRFENFDKVKSVGEFLYLCILTPENFEILRKRFGSALSDKIKKEIEALSNLSLFGQNKVENLFTLMKMYKLSPETIQNSMLIPNELKQMAQKYPMDNKQLDITGMDIMALGFKGKDVGEKIIEIFKAIFSDQIPNQKQAIIDYLKRDNKSLVNENESIETPRITSFRELVEKSPKELKDILYSNWQAKQNPKWHPEGNTLKHIIVVTNRAIKTEPYNINLILAGYFHDLGKMATYEISPKTGQPTAYGHENISADLVNKYQDFITELGGNPEVVNYIVKNHMKMKPSTWDVMKDVKKDVIKSHPNFSDLERFSTIDKGGLNEKQELKGGKADKLTLPQIAKKHKLPIEDLTSQLKLGIKTEMEHTDNKSKAKEIAMDHLAENPKYYTKLKKAKLEETVIDSLKTSFIESEEIPSKLKTDIDIEYHKKLNPKFWLNNHLKTNVRKKLLALAKFYFRQLDLGVKLKDIIFTGSLANYNYTNLSDIDLHLIIDYKELTDDEEFAKEFFGDKRALWADSNEIKINGYPVEIYVQDESELSSKGMGSLYSLLKNKWIKKPKYNLPNVDKHLITKKVNQYLDILNKISLMKDSRKKLENYKKVMEKIKTNRRESTKKEGEFSVDNLVFKILRNKKILDIIKDNKKEIVNNLFSIKSN